MNRTPLHSAACNNSVEIGELLISKGADINAKDITFLYIEIIIWITGINNKKRKEKKKNQTPLHTATIYASKDILELLIAKGSDINAKDIIYLNVGLFLFNNLYINKSRQLYFINQTPLHIVATTKNLNLKEIGEILIAKGADINAKDKTILLNYSTYQ